MPDAGVGCLQVTLEGVSHADEVGSVGWGGGADGGHCVLLGVGFIMGLLGARPPSGLRWVALDPPTRVRISPGLFPR